MPRFTVVWDRNVEDDLCELWLASGNRRALRDAADRIDAELAWNANEKGVALAEGLRTLKDSPLLAIFEVDASDRRAKIVAIRKID